MTSPALFLFLWVLSIFRLIRHGQNRFFGLESGKPIFRAYEHPYHRKLIGSNDIIGNLIKNGIIGISGRKTIYYLNRVIIENCARITGNIVF